MINVGCADRVCSSELPDSHVSIKPEQLTLSYIHSVSSTPSCAKGLWAGCST